MTTNKNKNDKCNKSIRRWRWILFIVIVFIIFASAVILAFLKFNSNPCDSEILNSCPNQRIDYLSIVKNWKAITPRLGERIVFIIILCLSIIFMWIARYLRKFKCLEKDKKDCVDPNLEHRYLVNSKVQEFLALLARDFGSLSFDISTHKDRAHIREYRGILHWHRDIIEKFLSFFLMVVFSLFLAKGFGYLYDFFTGNLCRFLYIPLDLNIAISMIGFALIIDGIVLVAAMTDAPGISRTLDSLIVVLAGVIILFLKVQPGRDSFVAFTLGDNSWLVIGLAIVIALLFLVRWVIGHATISELKGHQHDRDKDNFNLKVEIEKKRNKKQNS